MLYGLTHPGQPAAPPVFIGLARIPGTLRMAGITWPVKVLWRAHAHDLCDLDGARILVMGFLVSGCGSSLAVACNPADDPGERADAKPHWEPRHMHYLLPSRPARRHPTRLPRAVGPPAHSRRRRAL